MCFGLNPGRLRRRSGRAQDSALPTRDALSMANCTRAYCQAERSPRRSGHDDADGQCRYALRSADELDVMFISDRTWLGVEVKSRVSDWNIADYERGIYQVVKYRAVLEAQARIDSPGAMPEIHVVLVLERELPTTYRALAAQLGVTIIERVIPGSA